MTALVPGLMYRAFVTSGAGMGIGPPGPPAAEPPAAGQPNAAAAAANSTAVAIPFAARIGPIPSTGRSLGCAHSAQPRDKVRLRSAPARKAPHRLAKYRSNDLRPAARVAIPRAAHVHRA